MSSTVSRGNSSSALRIWLHRAAISLALAVTLAFQAWTFRTSNHDWPKIHGHQEDYYNLLSRGFLSGHLSLKKNPDPALVNLSDPYDPTKRAGIPVLHDVSYYKGKYYLYWGPAPALTLFLPFRYLTHNDLPQGYGNLIYTSIGFLALALLWLAIRRDFFPDSRDILGVLGVLALGACGMTLSLIRRPSLWEISIAAGHAYAMVGLLCLYLGLPEGAKKRWWALGSLFLGFAIASRATYMIGVAPLLLMLAFVRARQVWLERTPPWKSALWWKELFALGLPAGLIVIGLLIYNYQRFGHFLEFGLKYQLSGANEIAATHFSFRYIPFNAFVYYLAPAQWSTYFPFAQFIHTGGQPPGYYGIEYTYGLLLNEPVTLLALFIPLAFFRRTAEEKSKLGQTIACVSVFFAGVGAVLLCFWAATQRYMADFSPALVLLGCIGMLAIERRLNFCVPKSARPVRWLAVLIVGFSIFFGTMISFQLHGLLKFFSPKAYVSIGHFFDWPAYALEKLSKNVYGPIEMDITFPIGEDGKLEPILSTGYEFYSDQVFVRYIDHNHLQFGFDHLSRGTLFTRFIEVDFKKEHHLRIELGSLFPPEEHPFYDDKTAAERIDLTQHLLIALDDQILLERRQPFYESSPISVQIGGTNTTDVYGKKFNGRIRNLKRGDYKSTSSRMEQFGAVALRIIFPTLADGRPEPIVQTGESGKADTLYVRYVRDGYVHFAYDHWGVGGEESGDIAVDPNRSQELKVFMPSLLGPAHHALGLSNHLVVLLDHKVVWEADAPSYRTSPAEVSLGQNFAGSNACGDNFSGLVSLIRRDPDDGGSPNLSLRGGTVRVIFPRHNIGAREPLVVRGTTGAADILFVQYVDTGHLIFGVDHWGVGMVESKPIAIDYSEIHILSVGFSNGNLSKAGISIRLDGVSVWQSEKELYPSQSEPILGLNSIGASTCSTNFGGIIISATKADSLESSQRSTP